MKQNEEKGHTSAFSILATKRKEVLKAALIIFAGWAGNPPTVPQEGHNFEFSKNDFFDLISYFGPKIHMFFDKTALRRKNPRFYSNF